MQLFNALLLLLLFSFSHAEDTNTTLAELNATQEMLIDPKLREQKILEYQKELNSLEGQISKEKVWMKSYASYITSLEVKESLENIKKRIVDLRAQRRLSDAQHEELAILLSKELVLKSQMEMLSKTEVSPFASLLTPPHLEESHSITNPFEILTGISLLKTYNADFKEYLQRKDELTQLIDLIKQENAIYSDMLLLENNETLQKEADFKTKQLERFERALDTITVSADVHQKRLEVIELNINKDITTQLYKLANISIIVTVIFVFFFLIKIVVKKYITDHERFYMANKMITFANVTIIIIVLFFSYIENASYLVTILGFASAGIAIAMKDWFMSILGWLVIVLGGSIHVGDRIKVTMDGVEYVGDIMDISLLRMTLFEDVTLTTYMANRRAGRIIFIPNNYVFTRMIANYSHASLKTVWDGIDITITFDSNHKKAMYICKEIAKKYSKGYTDITRKQLNKLRSYYSLKNTNVEPRIFSLIEPNGIVISTWYLTNAYATLTLRSVISTDIIDAFNAEEDIKIAYPTQSIKIEKPKQQLPIDESV